MMCQKDYLTVSNIDVNHTWIGFYPENLHQCHYIGGALNMWHLDRLLEQFFHPRTPKVSDSGPDTNAYIVE